MFLNRLIKAKRNWLALVIVIALTTVLVELVPLSDASQLPTYMMLHVCVMFVSAVIGGFVARRQSFVVYLIAYHLLVTSFSYWVLFNIPIDRVPLSTILSSNAGWSGLGLLAGIIGVHVGVRIYRKGASEVTLET